MVSLRILVVGVASGAFVTGFSPWSAAVVTAPALRGEARSQMGFMVMRTSQFSAYVKEFQLFNGK